MSSGETKRLRALGPAAALRRSWQLMSQRPLATLGLGAALVSSGLALCCGLGVFAAPWFMCELFALHIESARGQAAPRSSAWFAAGVVQLAGLTVLSLLALFALLALGPDVLLGVEQAPRALALPLLESLLWLLAAGAAAIALGVHFQYAPALLIERGGGLYAALLESTRLVAQSGLLRSWLTSAFAHALPVLVIAAAFALQSACAGQASALVFGLLALPVIALSCALSQGMIIASYLALSSARATDGPARELPSARAGLPAFLLLALVLAVPLPVLAVLLKPSQLRPGVLPAHASLLVDTAIDGTVREPYLPDSALRLVLARDRVQVVASDGGGAGTLPLPARPIARVRVASASRSSYRLGAETGFAIELQLDDGTRYLTSIDGNGVRRDDSLKQRFALALPAADRALLALCWVWLALWLARSLPRQAQLYFAGDGPAFYQVAWRAWLWLLPPAALATTLGVWALLR